MDLHLGGRTVAVTSGGNGIGAAVAAELAGRGARVVVVDPGRTVRGEPEDASAARAVVAAITAARGDAEHAAVAVTDGPAVQDLLADIAARHGALDGLVHAAGTEGLDLSGRPPTGRAASCTGEVLFSVGSELSLNRPGALVEAVRTSGADDLRAALDAAVPETLVPAQRGQRTRAATTPASATCSTGPRPPRRAPVCSWSPTLRGGSSRSPWWGRAVTSRPPSAPHRGTAPPRSSAAFMPPCLPRRSSPRPRRRPRPCCSAGSG